MVDIVPPRAAPILSIIVPVFGVEDYVGDCIDSILNAPGFDENCELIIVDDGSLDGSMDIVTQRCCNARNITIIRQANAGLGAARNTGMANARGRYLWFVDSDDEICADAIYILVDCITRYASDVIAFEFETIGEPLNRLSYLPVFDQIVDPTSFLVSGRPPSPVQFYVFARSLIVNCGHAFEVGIYHEDALFTPLALTQAASLVRLRTVCYRYRLRPGSIMSASNPKKHLGDMLTVAEILGHNARDAELGSPKRKALAREIGFALAAAHHYAVRVDRSDLAPVAPVRRVFAAGMPWARHFPLKAIINYGRLLMLFASCPRAQPIV
jgi:glycosyltransferase involved in cell wall biosynthesis